MKLYAFELGRKKELCLAEIKSVFGEENIVERNLDTAIVKIDTEFPQQIQDKLGGTIKIVEIFNDLPFSAGLSAIKERIQKELEQEFENRSGKIPFAISLLSYKNPRDINIKELLNFSKKILKSFNLNSRFVNKNFANTKPSTIFKAKVLQKGIDINIIKGNNKIYLGKTVAIQNIDNYSIRDFDKPKRDARVGMLPPKLAQILINLAGESKTIYDPFCGTGTILMEGLLASKDVVGSDIDPRMIDFSKANIEWLTQTFYTKNNWRVFERDARFINKSLVTEKIDAIITEGYLGNPLTRIPNEEEREMIFRELANLHLNWLTAAKSILPKNGKIVMCVAAIMDKQTIHHLPRFEELAKTAGFEIEKTFTYDRPDQIVVRDIKVLKRQ